MTLLHALRTVRKHSLATAFLLLAGVLLLAAWQGSGSGSFLSGSRLVAAAAAPHNQLYVKVVGRKQGTFKGDSLGKGHLDQVLATAFDYGIVSPHDSASGQASGKRQHKPVTITKGWGPSMPQFLQAASTNEVLTVTMEFWDTDSKGKARIHYSVKLTNATIGEIRQRLVDDTLTQDMAFFFQSIQVDDKVGKTSYFDDWSGVL